jgi:eukaryotic-like serine/threonine-protein kinase
MSLISMRGSHDATLSLSKVPLRGEGRTVTLQPGTRLGPYEILASIGAGGMGEVYRAKDTRLDRTVAIKILPEHLSSNPDFKQRFEREARTISSLSHPYICALYDVGHQDGIDYLVMEFLEGETLDKRLEKGPLTTELVLRYGIQIAEALDKAHRQGIVHRDLKPGNIMITKSGLKLLDFGLAKLSAQPAVTLSGVSALLTEQAKNLTAEGMILGTVQYMSPEQLEGKESDHRTDLFALGTVLYEMATGKKAFTGKSHASLISAILKDEPAPISQIQPMTPAALDHIVKKCLAKDSEDRWQTAHDVGSELKWIAESSSAMSSPTAARHRNRFAWLGWGIAAVLLIGFVIALTPIGARWISRSSVKRPIRFAFSPPAGTTLGYGLALSPEGNRIAFVASRGATSAIWIRDLSLLDARPLSGTDDARFPFWSPDGRFLAFFAGGKLKKIEISTNSVQTLCDTSGSIDCRGGSWSPRGIIVFAPDFSSPLYRISENGGPSRILIGLDSSKNELSQRWPQFLPDGRHYLYMSRTGARDIDKIYVGSLDGGNLTQVMKIRSRVEFGPPLSLLFVTEGTLTAQPFDPVKFVLTGNPKPLGQELRLSARAAPRAMPHFRLRGTEDLFIRLVESPGINSFGSIVLVKDWKRLDLPAFMMSPPFRGMDAISLLWWKSPKPALEIFGPLT